MKHGTGPNYVNTFNEDLVLSKPIIELVKIDESTHEEAIVFLSKIDLKNSCVLEDDDGSWFKISCLKKVFIMIILDSWYILGGQIYISILN